MYLVTIYDFTLGKNLEITQEPRSLRFKNLEFAKIYANLLNYQQCQRYGWTGLRATITIDEYQEISESFTYKRILELGDHPEPLTFHDSFYSFDQPVIKINFERKINILDPDASFYTKYKDIGFYFKGDPSIEDLHGQFSKNIPDFTFEDGKFDDEEKPKVFIITKGDFTIYVEFIRLIQV